MFHVEHNRLWMRAANAELIVVARGTRAGSGAVEASHTPNSGGLQPFATGGGVFHVEHYPL
jgi:hypothetical protein